MWLIYNVYSFIIGSYLVEVEVEVEVENIIFFFKELLEVVRS